MTEMAEKEKTDISEREIPAGIRILPAAVIAAATVILAVLFLILPVRTFSENENRTLAAAPAFSVGGFLSGSFQEGFEQFLADQFPGRDTWFALSVRKERLLGRQEINSVYYAEDADGELRLIDEYRTPQNTEKFEQAVLRLAKGVESARVTVLLVPTAVTIYGDELPAEARARMNASQEETIRQIFSGIEAEDTSVTLLSAQEVLEQGRSGGRNMFYRTDHHWTLAGAYEGYRLLSPAFGIEDAGQTAGTVRTVSGDFRGTTWSKVCDPEVSPDTIEIYENPAWAGTLRVSYEDTGEESDSPYNPKYLKVKDQYSLFLNNLHPFITITNPGADLRRTDPAAGERRALAVVKDSYANSLIPFLIDRYETIYIFDPRYYRGSISGFVNDHPEVQDVLVLYNLCTMDDDRGVGAIK